MKKRTTAITTTTRAKVGQRGRSTSRQRKAAVKKAAAESNELAVQPILSAQRAYVRQNTQRDATPPSTPTAEAAANGGPLCRVRIRETGAEVSGRPMSHPLTPGPHLRPASVAAAMRIGARMSLRIRIMSLARSLLATFAYTASGSRS